MSQKSTRNLPIALLSEVRKRMRKQNLGRTMDYIYIYIWQMATIYIYIYGCGAICRRKFCHFYRVFPSFKVKNGQKEMLQICPVSVCSRSIEITQNWLETAVPSLFFQKSDWDCSFRPLYWFIWGLNVKFVGLFGPKKALNCRNVKHVKLYLSKKG